MKVKDAKDTVTSSCKELGGKRTKRMGILGILGEGLGMLSNSLIASVSYVNHRVVVRLKSSENVSKPLV